MDGNKIIFVTGTDTGVGKTVLTALLLHHLRESGINALAMKPFCSGGQADVRLLQSLQRATLSDGEMNPYYFEKPVAPLVAQKGRRPIRPGEVIKKIRKVSRRCDCLLIEGSGGLLVPLGPGFMVADLIGGLNCRVVVVARNRLGTINHTLLTISALLEYGVKRDALSVVLMSQGRKDLSSRTNRRVLADLLKTVPVLEIPFLIAKISSRAEILRSSRKLGKILKKLAARSEPV
jgi:dethiobiotin synthetase